MSQIIPSLIIPEGTNPNVSVNIPVRDFTDFYTPYYSIQGKIKGGGSKTDYQPLGNVGIAVDGYKVKSYKDLFYYNITVTPTAIDVGNVVSNTIRSLNIFNAYFVNKTLASANIVGDSGLSIAITTPYTFGPLQETNFDLTASSDGPATINAVLELDFTSEMVLVPITGLRVVPYLYQPVDAITEKLSWKTNVLTSYSGKEQRVRIRPLGPEQRISMIYNVRDLERQKSNLLISAWFPQTWGIPVWFEGSWLKGTSLSVAQDTIVIDTTKSDFRVGGLVLFIEDSTHFEVSQIESMTSSQFVLSFPLTKNFTNPYVIPMRVGIMDKSPSKDVYPNQSKLNVINTTFVVKDNVNITTAQPYITFRTLPVLEEVQLRQDSIKDSYVNNFEVNNPATGTISTIVKWDKSKYTRPVSFRFKTSEFWAFRKFLHYCKGQLYPFFLPTYEDDLNIVTTFANNATLIVISNVDFVKYGPQSIFRYIRLELNNGQVIYSKITNQGPNVNPLYEELTLDNALAFGHSVNPTDIKRCSLMCVARLSSDSVDITHSSYGYSDVSLNILGIDYDA